MNIHGKFDNFPWVKSEVDKVAATVLMKNIFGIILSSWWDPRLILPKIDAFVLFFHLSHYEFNEKLRNVTFIFAITALWLELGQVCSFFPFHLTIARTVLCHYEISVHPYTFFVCFVFVCFSFFWLLLETWAYVLLHLLQITAAFSKLKVNHKFIPFFIVLYFLMYFSPYVSPFYIYFL